MKIPSIIRLPKHQRFNIVPRHYDPVKEEIEERTSRIKKELSNSSEQNEVVSAISGRFTSKRVREERKSSYFQIILIVDLLSSFIAYVQWGNPALYFLACSVIFLIFLKMKKIL